MSDYTLADGAHESPVQGRCAMEWVAYLAGEPHTHKPVCVSPVLTAFCIALNDLLIDEPRQKLRPYLARTIGTASDGLDLQRAWMATDWVIRVYTPTWLACAGLEAAERMRALPPVMDVKDLKPATDVLNGTFDEARAAMEAVFCLTNEVQDVVRSAVDGTATPADAARRAVKIRRRDRRPWNDMMAAVRTPAIFAAAARADFRGARPTEHALAPAVQELLASSFALLDRMLPTVPLVLPVVEDAQAVCGAP